MDLKSKRVLCCFIVKVLLVIHFTVAHEQEVKLDVDLNVDTSNYVDPHDMLNYNPQNILSSSTKRIIQTEVHEEKIVSVVSKKLKSSATNLDAEPVMKKHQGTVSADESKATPTVSKLEQKNLVKKEKDKDISTCPATNPIPSKERPFLGRFLKTLSNTLQLEKRIIVDNGDILHIPLSAKLTKQSLFILQEILKEGEQIPFNKLSELDEILNYDFLFLDTTQYEEKLCESTLVSLLKLNPKEWLPAMFVACLFIVLWMLARGCSIHYLVGRSFVMFFLLSWLWHWIYRNQLSSSKRQADISRNPDMPLACRTDQQTYWDSIKLWMSTNIGMNADPCEEYHRALLTDPTFEVTPMAALVDMMIVAVLQPLGFVGKSIGAFFDNVLDSAGWLNKIPVLICVLLLVLFILVLVSGYEVHLPFFKMRPSAPIAMLSSNTESIATTYSIEPQSNVQRTISFERSLSSVGTQVQIIERLDSELIESYIDCSTDAVSSLEAITEQDPPNSSLHSESGSEDEDDIEVLDTVTLTEM